MPNDSAGSWLCKLILRNYRCFEDTQPGEIDFGPGITAFAGPNNSGKSTLLRFFYEMRAIVGPFADPNNLINFASRRNQFTVPAFGAEDPIEIFHNGNQRPLSVEFQFPGAGEFDLAAVVFFSERANPSLFTAELYFGPARRRALGWYQGRRDRIELEGGYLIPFRESDVKRVHDFVAGSMYIGPYRNVITEGGKVYFDLQIGTMFASQWHVWKSGTNRLQNIAAQRVVDDIAEIFGYDRLEIDVAPDAQTLHIVADRKNYRLRELGAGLAQFLVVFGNAAMRKPTLILIDEPELHLHPSLQLEFLLSLASYATQGVMLSTHSIGLARSSTERIYSLQRHGSRSIVRPFEQTINFVEFLGEMSFSAFKELGHEVVLMAEGVSDVKTLQQLLRVLGIDHKVVVLPIGGAQFITAGRRQELSELQRLTRRIAILIDSERTSEASEIAATRKAFIEDCTQLGFTVCATRFRAIENYFPERAVQEGVGNEFHALGPFDGRGAMSWPKSESWRIARRMRRDEIEATDVGRFLVSLA